MVLVAKVMSLDGIERWQYRVVVTLSEGERDMVRKIAKGRGWTFHDVLHGCFAEGLEDLGQRIDDELPEEEEFIPTNDAEDRYNRA